MRTRITTAALSLVGALGLAASHAHAQANDGEWAQRYAHRSVSFLQQGGFTYIPSRADTYVGRGNPPVDFSLGGAARIAIHRLLVEPMFGASVGAGVVLGSGTVITSWRLTTGVGIGAAFALTRNFALSPMGRVTFDIPVQPGGTFTALLGGELPFTIFVGRNGFFEPYVLLGTLIVAPDMAPSYAYFAVGAGCRIGLTF
jgi:hypothetical protein